MKILLVGNYDNSRQQSMRRFPELLRQGLTDADHEVRLVRPPVMLGRLRRGETGLAKWIGYIDRFLLYPPLLRRQVRWADVVHICDQANAVYLPHLRDKPQIITCHDMLAIRAALGEIAESPTAWSGRVYQRWILNNLASVRLAACVSGQTATDLQRLTGMASDDVAVIPNALNYPYRPMAKAHASDRLKALGLAYTEPFLLHVGGNQWYKNRQGVLRIFAELIKHPRYAAHRLVMAGKPWTAELHSLVHDLKLTQRVTEMGTVSNEDLRCLYSAAEALLFPSLREGFGWPIIEAQACGCAVITTKRAPMTDVGGSSAIYVDSENYAAAAATIAETLPQEPTRRRNAGFDNAKRFSKITMINNYLASYRAAVADTVRKNNEQADIHRGEYK